MDRFVEIFQLLDPDPIEFAVETTSSPNVPVPIDVRSRLLDNARYFEKYWPVPNTVNTSVCLHFTLVVSFRTCWTYLTTTQVTSESRTLILSVHCRTSLRRGRLDYRKSLEHSLIT